MSQIDLANSLDLDQFRSTLTMLARMYLGTRLQQKFDGSDIVQETFLEAHQHLDQCRGRTKSQVFAWLRQILTNNIFDAVREYSAAKRDINREVRWERRFKDSVDRVETWLSGSCTPPIQNCARNEQLERLGEALFSLPESQRVAIELFHIQCCSLKEVAQEMNRTVPAVAGLLHRGLKRLRHILE